MDMKELVNLILKLKNEEFTNLGSAPGDDPATALLAEILHSLIHEDPEPPYGYIPLATITTSLTVDADHFVLLYDSKNRCLILEDGTGKEVAKVCRSS